MRTLTVLLCAACALSACDSSGPIAETPAQAAYRQASDAAVRAVEAAIGHARAADVASCRALPLGENAAGNPTFYRVYSLTDGDPERVLALAARIAELDRQAIADGVLIGSNPTPTPYAIKLRDGRCLPVGQVIVD